MANSMMVIDGSQSSKNETEKMQLDCLMEKLRSKNRRQKTAIEAIKIFHTVSNDKKSGFDLHLLHSQLNSLRGSINVGKASYTLDRLEAVSVECGIKFNTDMSRGEAIFSCDIFNIRFSVNDHGNIGDVVITMNSESRSCPELLKALKNGNYDELRQHLEGLILMNDISSDKKIKSKVVMALQSLESDLNSLSMYQNSITSMQNYVHRSPLGILVPRVGGLPMKLIYFVGPYDLLSKQDKTSIPMTLEAIIEKDVGHSLMVGIEKSQTNNKMQISTLMLNNNSSDGKNLPIFAPLNNSNSCSLPVQFVVKLKDPIVLSWTAITKIQQVTGMKMMDASLLKPVVSLLVEQMGKLKKNNQNVQRDGTSLVVMPSKGSFLCFSNPINSNLMGCLVDKIAFTHPTHLPTIVAQLRQQILFNTLVCSCIKSMDILSPQNLKEFTSRDIQFEVVPLSLQLITATFQHPIKDSLLTIMLELNDSITVTCKMTGEHIDLVASNDYITKITQRCLSLPVVIRSIFKRSPHLRNRTKESSIFPPLVHLSRQSSCLIPDPSQFNKKYVASKSLESIGDYQQAEERLSFKISVPKLLANFSIPPRMQPGDEVQVKMEQGINQENQSGSSNILMQQCHAASQHLLTLQYHDAKMKKEMMNKSSESDIEIIEKPSSIAENALLFGRSQSLHHANKMDKVSSNPMLASLLDHSSGLNANNNQNMMGANINLSNVNKSRKRPANEWGPGNMGGRSSKKSKTSNMPDDYFPHQFQQIQQHQQLLPRNQISDSGGGIKLNSGGQPIKMSEAERSLAVMARQMSDPTSFQNFAAWQNSTNCTGPSNMIGQGTNNSAAVRHQSLGGGMYYDKDVFSSNQQNRMQPKGNCMDGINANAMVNSKHFSNHDADWEVKIEPNIGESSGVGVMQKSSMTIEKQPPIKMRFDKRSFVSSTLNAGDIGRQNNHESSVSSSPLSTGSSDMKRQMSSSLTDLLSDDNNHSNSADSEVGILTSGRDSIGSIAGMTMAPNPTSRCSSSPRLPIKRIVDAKDVMEVRGGMLNPNMGLVGNQHQTLKKLKSTSLVKNSDEKKAKRAYSCTVSIDDAKQKLSKKQKIYEFDDDECIVTATTSPIASQVPSGTPTVKITNAGGKFKLQNSLKSKQMTSGLGGMAVGRQGQLSVMMVGQKAPKPFGSHHMQAHHPRLNKTAVRPKSIETKPSGRSDSKGISRTPSQTFIQSSTSPITVASTSPFQMPSPMNQSQYQQTKFKPPQCTMPMSFSSVNPSNAPSIATTSKFNSSASTRSVNATVSTNVKSKSPSSSGELKQGASKKALNSVIDTLKKKQANGADGSRVLEGAVAQKEKYDAIRLEIIREGNKPSTPSRDQLVASSSKLNNQKKLNPSDNLSVQSRNANYQQFQQNPKNHMKTTSKSPSPNNFSTSVNQGNMNIAASKPVVAVTSLNMAKTNLKCEAAMTKPISFNSGFASSSPNSTFSSSGNNAQMFSQSRNMTEVLDMNMMKSSCVSSSLPMLSPSVLPPASNSHIGFNSRAVPGNQNQRLSVLSSQVVGTRYQEKSPMKMQLPYNQDMALKMLKLNDISEKCLSRHFLDVVSSVDSPGTSTTTHMARASNPNNVNSTLPNISGNVANAPVVERLLSPPRSPSPSISIPMQSNDSTLCSPQNKSQIDEQKESSFSGPNQSERMDDFVIQKGKNMNSMSGRIIEVSPSQMSSDIHVRTKPQRCQSRDFDDIVTVDDEKCESPDNDLVIDVSPSSSPVMELSSKVPAATTELSSGHQNSHLVPLNVPVASSAYLLDLTNSPPTSSVQSDIPSLPINLPTRPSSNWVHKSPPSSTALGQKSQPSSVNSVMCELDDDLMNEALIM